ncbi:MAG TPA: TlpA disulfide reductase family protein [Thermomicrobiales bacterium]|jgi:peroxiredoxin|nr:TlpA disulfide reductase family protein [Thermomicrobiales bacterium]
MPAQRPESTPNRPMTREEVRLDELTVPKGRVLSRTQVVVSLVLAVAIVAGAWLAGGRLGMADIGTGGISRQYLPKVGEQAPTLGFLGANGQTSFLSQYRGQPVWINFWGSWCPPCQAEFPEIEAAYRALEPQGVVLLAISAKETWDQSKTFADANGATFPVYNIPDLTIFGSTWDTRNFPTHMYIDRDGVVRYISTAPGKADDLIERGEWLLAGDWSTAMASLTEEITVAIRREDLTLA